MASRKYTDPEAHEIVGPVLFEVGVRCSGTMRSPKEWQHIFIIDSIESFHKITTQIGRVCVRQSHYPTTPLIADSMTLIAFLHWLVVRTNLNHIIFLVTCHQWSH